MNFKIDKIFDYSATASGLILFFLAVLTFCDVFGRRFFNSPVTGTIELVSGFTLNGTDDSSSNAGDFIVLNTSADDGDRLLFEDGTSDPIAVLASHGITLSGQGWNAFRFENP